jgi:hypothetical protein
MATVHFESVHHQNFGKLSNKVVLKSQLEWAKNASLPLLTGRWMQNALLMA